MKNSLPFSIRRRSLLLLLSFGCVLLPAPRGAAQAPPQGPKTASSTSDPAVQAEAQKKAAERKRRFEEQKNLLDGGGSVDPSTAKHTPVKDSEFWMNPIGVNLLPNQTQEIHVWDWRGNDVSARVSWSLNNSGIVDMQVKHHAIVTAKMPGTVSVIGKIDGHTVEAIVTVYRGEKLPPGVPPYVTSQPRLNHGGRHRTSTVLESPN